MKNVIDTKRTELLKYDIRALTVISKKLKTFGVDIWAWENIGDPIQQGHQVPQWMKDEVIKQVHINSNWGYAPTEGLHDARHFIATQEHEKGVMLDEDDIVFTSGLGHGINTTYQAMVGSGIRTIHPSPSYPAHSSTESFFAGRPPITYTCLPDNNWQPDLIDLEKKMKKHPEIGFILVIVPNNPTGVCYDDTMMNGIADIARKYNLGVISDETYIRLVFKDYVQTGMAEIMMKGEPFPLIVMKSMSKDIPWPGGRAGWLEFYNPCKDEQFEKLKKTIKQSLRVQVGSTTMAQAVLPHIYGDPRYTKHLLSFLSKIEEQNNYVSGVLNTIGGISCVKGQGAFYLSAVFKQGVLKPHQTLPIENKRAKEYIEELVKDPSMPLDKRFVLYLMASKRIFITPLSSFEGPLGFRVTTLKTDLNETKKVYQILKESITEYLKS